MLGTIQRVVFFCCLVFELWSPQNEWDTKNTHRSVGPERVACAHRLLTNLNRGASSTLGPSSPFTISLSLSLPLSRSLFPFLSFRPPNHSSFSLCSFFLHSFYCTHAASRGFPKRHNESSSLAPTCSSAPAPHSVCSLHFLFFLYFRQFLFVSHSVSLLLGCCFFPFVDVDWRLEKGTIYFVFYPSTLHLSRCSSISHPVPFSERPTNEIAIAAKWKFNASEHSLNFSLQPLVLIREQ